MLNLPTELTLMILSYLSYLPFNSLSRLQSVCKSWNELCKEVYRRLLLCSRQVTQRQLRSTFGSWRIHCFRKFFLSFLKYVNNFLTFKMKL